MKEAVEPDCDELVQEDLKVEWQYIGEGYCGYYNEKDPQDKALLRFYFSRWNPEYKEWEDLEDASYCTRFPYEATPEQRRAGLKLLMDRFSYKCDGTREGRGWKKLCERLSWIGLDWLDDSQTSMGDYAAYPGDIEQREATRG